MNTHAIKERYLVILEHIAQAAKRSGRSPQEVTLMAVTKTVPSEFVISAYDVGVRLFGENRVQEAEHKTPNLRITLPEARWAMIGHLQSNKASKAALLFDEIHTVDSRALAERLNQQCASSGKTLPVLVEVNSSGEANKSGVRLSEAPTLVGQVADMTNLRLGGLLTIGPLEGDESAVRRAFSQTKCLFDSMPEQYSTTLSMGMSGDYEWAIEEGATQVRIGSALFGRVRHY